MIDDKAAICLTVGADEDGTTARGVLRRARGVSQRLVRKIAHGDGDGGGALFINGKAARFRDKVKAGDEIRLVFPVEESWIEPEDIPLAVLYEDEYMIAIDKAPGLVVHPTRGHREGTVAGAIVYHMRQRGESYKPRFISRLDMDTSGVLLVGKNSHAQDNLAKQAAAGSLEKYYIAVVEGRLEDDLPGSGIIDLPIGLERPGEPRRAVIPEEEGGLPSRTEYEVIEHKRDGSFEHEHKRDGSFYVREHKKNRPFCVLTVVRARLITGRTHQIRVHFAHCGHPILGDRLYGQPSLLIARQALHAAKVVFSHPGTGRPHSIEAPLPDDMAGIVNIPGVNIV